MAENAKVAIVTGAGSGIGRAAALALARAGYAVALAGRRIDALEETRRLAEDARVIAVATDVTNPTSVHSLFEQTIAAFGRVDVLFNNAGANVPAATIDELPVEQWRSVIDVNLTGAFLCAAEAFRVMRHQSPRGGRIINNGSISAQTPRPMSAAYTASKHAISGLTKSIALDGRPFDIACGQIDIGNALTDMAAKMSAGVRQANGAIATEPTFNVEHVAEAVVHMANLPLSANILSMTIMATNMPFVGRG